MSAILRTDKVFLLLLLVIGASEAQTTFFERQQSRWLAPSVSLQYWNIEEESIHQVAIPLTFVVPLSDKWQANLSTSPAFSRFGSDPGISLDGLSDVRMSGSWLFGEDRFLATFGVNLPSGKHALKAEEFQVANILALHAFDFDVPILGQGLDATAGVVAAQRMGEWVLGVGVGYLMRGPFEPIENATAKYNPGDEVNVSVGIDKPLGRKNKLMMDANYTVYGTDTVSGSDVFQAGNRMMLQAMLYMPRTGLSWLFSARDRVRAKNKSGSGTLIPERQNSNGNELELAARALLPLTSMATLHGTLEGRIYSNNAYDIGGAIIAGVGGGYDRKLSAHLVFNSDLRFYFGSLDYGEDVSVKGVRGTMGFKIVL